MSSRFPRRRALATSALAAALVVAAQAGADTPPARVLKVCADPANRPLSSEAGDGVENRVAALVARALKARLETTWWAQRRGFFRRTLGAGLCDVVVAVPKGLDAVRTTRPWYRSTFTFVVRTDRADLRGLRSLDDPRLRSVRIGVPLAGDDGANPTPVHALSRRGVIDGLRGFPLFAELGREVPAIVDAVARGEVDVGVVWGPVAGPAVKRARLPLTVTPVAELEDDGRPLAFSMAMGVRKGDEALAKELDDVLVREAPALARLLADEGVVTVPLDAGGPRAK